MSGSEKNTFPSFFRIKPEPVDYHFAPFPTLSTRQQGLQPPTNSPAFPKPEPFESPATHNSARALSKPSASNAGTHFICSTQPKPVNLPPTPLYNTYGSVQEIPYTPENALKQGIGMAKAVKKGIEKLELGSEMRKSMWLREIAGLENLGGPTTLIAVCGATGAGKSSLLNAILDDNIVPTSGMRACTAVVTEIAYHNKPTIDAEVSFLTLDEWKEELTVLLDDLIDEDGNIKRATDLRSEAGIAWHKVHAVYPSISPEQLAGMTPDQIIECDRSIAARLGTTKLVCAGDSKAFATQISKYIDSKDRKRDQQKGRKDKDKNKKERGKDSGAKKGGRETDHDSAALWPLIRQVVVRCRSAALSTGAILVDLPGVADANAARSNICKDYMKKCQAIWVLAPITRAVDDRTAKDLLGDAFKIQLMMDGNYDDSTITFVATKTDDISCTEVIRNLKLEDDEEIEAIEEKIDQIKADQKKWKISKAAAEKAIKATQKQLVETRAIVAEYRNHLAAAEKGESFKPILTARKAKSLSSGSPNSKKRKPIGTGRTGSPKRKKSISDDEASGHNDDIEDDEDGEDDQNDTDAENSEENDSDADDSDLSTNSGSGSDEDSYDEGIASEAEVDDDKMDDDEEEVTKESLMMKIEESVKNINILREGLSKERSDKKKAHDELANANDRLAKAQLEKNGICSVKRSEFSRDVLKDDFRTGLREIDEADAQERDPDNFDPTQQLRNYDSISMPTFCASARDYIRIKKQVKGDGKPTCFTNVYDTGIPALQDWCQTLTISSRQRIARTFFTHLRTFTTSVRNYLQGIAQVREVDRNALRDQWESVFEQDPVGGSQNDDDAFDPLSWMNEDVWEENASSTFTAKSQKQKANVDIMGEPIGVTHRLTKEFGQIVDTSVEELKNNFASGLHDKLQIGAAKAAADAVNTSDEFAASMHWGSYRATLRRNGSYRRCLNTELVTPLTRSIASSWARVFEADLFASLETQSIFHMTKLIQDVERSSPPVLKDRAKQQGMVALEEAKVAMKTLVTVVQKILNGQQKEISRCLVPHVQRQLQSGYSEAFAVRGRGSVARQKAIFHDFIKHTRHNIFTGGADTLLERLDSAANSIGDALDSALVDLAMKVEVSLSVLWESPRDDPRQMRARREAVNVLQGVDEQAALWTNAAQNAQISSR